MNMPFFNDSYFINYGYQGTAIRDRIQERSRGQQSRDLLENGNKIATDEEEDDEYYYVEEEEEEYFDNQEQHIEDKKNSSSSAE